MCGSGLPTVRATVEREPMEGIPVARARVTMARAEVRKAGQDVGADPHKRA